MIDRRYLNYLSLATAAWVLVYFGLTLAVDPYGISPLRWNIPGINQYKPARIDIDRQLKPYEVWRYQPATLYLGTSRIHQAMDPAVLNGSAFATAYNASIPASTLEMNVEHLREYVRNNPRLRTVVVELFFYNFAGESTPATASQSTDFLMRSTALFVSADTFGGALKTLAKNIAGICPCYEIKSGGHFFYPEGHDPRAQFAGFAAGVWKLHRMRNDFKLNDSAFQALKEMVSIALEHRLDIRLILTPNHVYDDYYLDAVGAWDTVEAWLHRLADISPLHSFAQPNAWTQEPVGSRMRYWNDPYHFTLHTGRAMQLALFRGQLEATPDGFYERLTRDKIRLHVENRKQAVKLWAAAHPDFVKQFKQARVRHDAAAVRSPDAKGPRQ